MDSFHQYSTTILGGSVALLIFLYRLLRKTRVASSKGISAPEPVGAWPLIGHLPLLMGSQLTHVTLGNLAHKYGPAFVIRLGVHKALVVSSAEVAKECLATNDKAFATRPKSVAVKLMGYNYAFSGLGPSGPYWREMRKIIIHELLSNQRLDSLKHIWISEINSFVKELYQSCVAKSENGKQLGLMEMRQLFSDITLKLFIRLVAGDSAKMDGDDAKRFQKASREFFRLAGTFMVADAIPYLGWLDFGNERAMKRTAKELDAVFARLLNDHRENRLANREKVDEQDFMEVLLTILDDKDMFGYTAGVVNKAICLNMILAGANTLAATLTWALSLLLNNQQTLRKAEDEIYMQVGEVKQVDDSDVDKLVYLQAIVKETMRLYPSSPLSGPRQALEDCTVAGYYIPVGTRLIVNLHQIHRDPKIWSDPFGFQPERFLTTQANVDVRGQDFELLPFGSGRRICPGIPFSLRFVHLALARLLLRI